MIKLADTALLAFTKLRARKIRTVITVLLASLLFGVLIAVSLVMTGAFRSVESFREDGLTSRYIVSVYPNSGSDTLSQLRRNPQLISEAKKRYEKLVEEKKAEAEKLELPYTQASDQPPYTLSSDGKSEMLVLNDKNGIVFDLLQEYFKDKPVIDDAKLKETAQQYHAIKLFSSTYRQVLRSSTLDVLPGGKEKFYDQTDDAERNANYVAPIINKEAMTLTPSEITTPFMLPNNASWKPDGTSIPIILPQNSVERLLGNDTTIDRMSAADKLAHLKKLREDAADLTVQACYRNSASTSLIQQTIQQQKEMKAGENNKDYQKPKVIYELPDPTKCENPHIISDTRTDEEKKQDDNQELFDKKFNDKTEPESYFVTFKVVGISPAEPENVNPADMEQQASNINDIVDDLLKTSGVGQVIPQSLYDELDDTAKEKYANLFTFTPTYFIGNEDDTQRYVEFANVKDAQRFIDEQGCTVTVEGVCKPIERDYQLSLAFTNSAALDDIQGKAQEWFGYAMLAVVVLAAVIMWITIGRAIADGRHETAVFRAIGFKRGDIAAVYVLYTIILSVLVAVVAAGIGWLGASIANQQLAPSLTAQAQYGFGGLDMAKEVNLIGFDQQRLLFILVACFATGLFSMIIPLVGNVRRSPIRDMREE